MLICDTFCTFSFLSFVGFPKASGSFVNLESKDYYTSMYDGKTGRPGGQCSPPGSPPVAPTAPTYEQWEYCGMDLADSDANGM